MTVEEYVQFLLASPRVVTAAEAGRVQPDRPRAPAHDAFPRSLARLEPDPAALWDEVRPLIQSADGVLVIDDSTLDKPRAKHIDLVSRHGSGNHWAVVTGINPVTLLWSDDDRLYPTDYRLDHKDTDGKTKNDHFADLLDAARPWGLRPIDHGSPLPLSAQPVAAAGTAVWRPGFGLARVFRVVAPNGDTTHRATNDLGLRPRRRGGRSPSCRGGSRSSTGG